MSIIQYTDDEHSEDSDDSIPELQQRVPDDTLDDDTIPELQPVTMERDDGPVNQHVDNDEHSQQGQQTNDCFDNFERYLEMTRTVSMDHINSLQWDDTDLYWDDDPDHVEGPYWANNAHKL